jgi:hypothetical protein
MFRLFETADSLLDDPARIIIAPRTGIVIDRIVLVVRSLVG